MDDSKARLAGLAAVTMAVASVLLAPLNSLARMRTEDGRSDFYAEGAHWWAAPATDIAEPVLDFASPDTVYATYGKFFLLALLAVIACALAMRSRRPPTLRWSERWGWRITIASYAVMAAGMLYYWVAPMVQVDALYLVVLLGMLGSVFGHVLLGIVLIRSGFRPRLTGWVLATEPVTATLLVAFSTQALGMWPMMLAWGAAGWALWRSGAEVPAREPAHA